MKRELFNHSIINFLGVALPITISASVMSANVYHGAPWRVTFVYHPTFMTFAWLFMTSQALLVLFSKTHFVKYLTGDIDRRTRVQLHAWINLTSLWVICLGVVAILWHKIKMGKTHFSTLHSFCGLVTFVWTLAQMTFGLLLFLKKTSKSPSTTGLTATLANNLHLKRIHRTLGMITYGAVTITMILGLFSNFAQQNIHPFIVWFSVLGLLTFGASALAIGLRLQVPSFLKPSN
jgi:hypothetical protein